MDPRSMIRLTGGWWDASGSSTSGRRPSPGRIHSLGLRACKARRPEVDGTTGSTEGTAASRDGRSVGLPRRRRPTSPAGSAGPGRSGSIDPDRPVDEQAVLLHLLVEGGAVD